MPDDFDLDDLDLDTDERTVTIRVDQLRNLRDKAKKAGKVGELEREIGALRREKQVRSTPGLAGLSDKQLAATLAVAGDDASPEDLAATAADLGFVAPSQESDTADADAAANDQIARTSEGSARPGKGELTPDEIADWPPDRLLGFRDAHPDLADALLQGESVTRPTGF